MMDESQRIRATVEKRCDGLRSSLDKILEYHERVPPSNPEELDLMERVLKKFKVGRMDNILNQFNVERAAGVKRERKAALIVKNVPRDQLIKLFESPEEQEETKTKATGKPNVS